MPHDDSHFLTGLPALIATATASLAAGYLLARHQMASKTEASQELKDEGYSSDDEIIPSPVEKEIVSEECKLVLVVRTDLQMTKGKIAAQCGHATLAAYKKSLRTHPKTLRAWEYSGQAKIALKARSEDELELLQAQAASLNLVAEIIHDAGRTQIAANSATVLAIGKLTDKRCLITSANILGPGPVSTINQVTGSLSLL